MALVYIIIAHRQPELLLRLARRLAAERTTLLIHVDERTAGSVFERILRGTKGLPNTHFLERNPCRWGDFGHLRATLKGIREIFDGGIPFDHALLLTGQDYPIKTSAQIADFFDRNEGRSFMSHFALPTELWTDGGLPRFERWHARRLGRHIALPLRRHVPKGLAPFGGSSYWCLTRECLEYADRFIRDNPGFVDFFKHVDIPDELFFQTLLMNSPLAPTIVDDNLRHIRWETLDAASPSVLRVRDLAELASSDKLFARKFDLEVDAEIVDRIDREILHRGPDPP